MFLFSPCGPPYKRQEKELTHLWIITGKRARRAVAGNEQKEENRSHPVDSFLG